MEETLPSQVVMWSAAASMRVAPVSLATCWAKREDLGSSFSPSQRLLVVMSRDLRPCRACTNASSCETGSGTSEISNSLLRMFSWIVDSFFFSPFELRVFTFLQNCRMVKPLGLAHFLDLFLRSDFDQVSTISFDIFILVNIAYRAYNISIIGFF